MCGIFAALSRFNGIKSDYSHLLSCISHRGPDDTAHQLISLKCKGTPSVDRAWLGHTRLSILDLSPRGRQPMATPDENLVIIFNGEIYNFVELRDQLRQSGSEFSTDSDTEVLLQAWKLWGENCLLRLKGMFAFVVIDRAAGTATLVRDCFGIKPLYYSVTADTVLICSEVLPLLETGSITSELNADVAYEYLRFGATASNDRTILRDIKPLSPGHVAVFNFYNGKLEEPRRYWALTATETTIPFRDAVSECRERFLDNVRLHLRSDVPVGAALSGGIDSSAIVCAMRHLEPDLDLKTFSYVAADASKSEERWVDLVFQQVGGKCYKIRPNAEGIGNDLELLVRHQGEPFGSASMLAQFLVFRRAREEGVPVTLDGQGADELLGGYWPHVGTYAGERLRAGSISGALRIVLNAAPGPRGPLLIGAMLAQNLLPPRARSLARKAGGFALTPKYLNSDWLAHNDVNAERLGDEAIGRYTTLKEHLIATVEKGSLPNLLRYADRSSMAFSVESRVPFLTPDFAEFIMSLPPSYIVSDEGSRKYVFREAMKGLLPEAIRVRKDKIGFFADDGLWLRTNRSHFEGIWRELCDLPMFDPARLSQFLDDFWAGRHKKAELVWRLLVFGYWHREVKRSLARSNLD